MHQYTVVPGRLKVNYKTNGVESLTYLRSVARKLGSTCNVLGVRWREPRSTRSPEGDRRKFTFPSAPKRRQWLTLLKAEGWISFSPPGAGSLHCTAIPPPAHSQGRVGEKEEAVHSRTAPWSCCSLLREGSSETKPCSPDFPWATNLLTCSIPVQYGLHCLFQASSQTVFPL